MPIINQIVKGGGTTPTGTINITSNGTHDVTNYATADVAVPTTAPAHYIEKSVDANGKLVAGSTIINLNGVTDINTYMLYGQYYRASFPSNTSLDMSSLTTISNANACSMAFYESNLASVDMGNLTTINGYMACSSMFYGVRDLASVNLSSLTTINSYMACNSMFNNCIGLTNINVSNLITIEGKQACEGMFGSCSGLTNIDISGLTTINGDQACKNMFENSRLTTVKFSSLTTINDNKACENMFFYNPNLTDIYFSALKSLGSYTSQFNNMLIYTTGCTVHFPSNMQSVIGSWSSVTGGFGGTNTTVLFDLPATNTLTGADTVTYTRNPKYDTATALAWKVGAYGTTNFTPAYYTSGTTDPAVSDTIYSDAACTTAVTTISSIA